MATQSRSIHNPAIPITGAGIEAYLGGGSLSNSGAYVNARTSLSTSPVWQAVDHITGDVSRTPFITYREDEDGRRRERAKKHPVYNLLRRSVGKMTTDLWLARIVGHALLYGNGYSRVLWRGARVVGLEWHPRDSVSCEYDRGDKYYYVQYDHDIHGRGTLEVVPASDMLHIVGLTLDEFGGLSLIDFARNTVGRHLSGERWADDFFGNYGMPAGWFMSPVEISDTAKENFLRRVQNRHGGHGNRWKTGILEDGMTWQSAGVNPKDALLIEAMGWGVKDVARFFNLPPHKLGDDSRTSYNSLEQENEAYRSSSLGKWFSRLEFACNSTLFLPSEQEEGYYCEFLQDSIGKADTKTRYESYAIAIASRIMNPNEVRARENLNPYEGGDEFLTPLNMAAPDAEPEDEPPSDPEGEPEDETPDAARAAAIRYDLVRRAIEDGGRLLANAANRAARKPGNFLAAINGLDARFRAGVEDKIGPAILAATIDRPEPDAVRRAADQIFAAAVRTFVEASECQPESLPERVEAGGAALLGACPSIAQSVLFKG